MSECAFDISLINNFDNKMEAWQMREYIEQLPITNIRMAETDDESISMFCHEFHHDLKRNRANPLAYLRSGMNARLAWELRKSALLWFFMGGPEEWWFIEEHRTDWTVKDIKDYRTRILSTKFIDYEDKDWQYFWVLRFSQRDFIKIRIAAETLFADWDPNKPDELGDPVRDLANRIIPVPGYKPKLII